MILKYFSCHVNKFVSTKTIWPRDISFARYNIDRSRLMYIQISDILILDEYVKRAESKGWFAGIPLILELCPLIPQVVGEIPQSASVRGVMIVSWNFILDLKSFILYFPDLTTSGYLVWESWSLTKNPDFLPNLDKVFIW